MSSNERTSLQDKRSDPMMEDGPLLPKTTNEATPLYGYSLMALAAVAQAFRALLFHFSETVYGFPPCTSLLLSATVFLILSSTYVYFGGIIRRAELSHKMLVQLFLRGLCTAITLYCNNMALARVDVGVALTLFSTTPAITSVFAAVFLGDHLSCADMLVLAVNLGGIMLVSQPTTPDAHPEAATGIMAALCGAISAAVGFMLLKMLGPRVHFMLHLLAIGVGLAIVSLMVTSASNFALLWQDPTATLVSLAGATAGFVTQGFVNRGMQLCRLGPGSVVRTVNVPVSFMLGLAFLGETVSWMAGLGVGLVLASVAYIGCSQYLKRPCPVERRDATSMEKASQMIGYV